MNEDELPPRRTERSSLAWVIVALAVITAGVALWWFTRGAPTAPGTPDASVVTPSVPPTAVADAGDVVFEDEPNEPSGASPDERLRRQLASRVADTPAADWIDAPGIVQRTTAAVWLISQGKSPRGVLGFVAIPDDFAVDETAKIDEPITIAPKAYARYDGAVRALKAVGPEMAAKIYRRSSGSFERSFREVARPGQRFDEVLRSAIDRLLAVEIPNGPVEVVPKGGIFVFADPKLEGLDEAQKHLLRLGPDNARAVQDFLRSFAAAANI